MNYINNMEAENSFISIDWGTSNLRIRFISDPNFQIQGEFFYNHGLKKMNEIWEESKDIFPNKKKFLLDKLLEYIDKTLFEHANIKNIIISGMASSSIGIQELDYSTIPFDLFNPKIILKKIEWKEKIISLISGVKKSDDIMRGEETQVIGITDEFINQDNVLIIVPGTHSKHIYCNKGIITDFKTFMTGEIFNSFAENTILSQSIEYDNFKEEYEISFLNGLDQIKKGFSLINAAFKLRTNDLFKKKSKRDNYHFLSGLLLGEELLKLDLRKTNKIIVYANPKLAKIYTTALKHLETKKEIICIPEKKLAKSQALGQFKIYKQSISEKSHPSNYEV
ncbi:MAG: 2-dehydro-3-deoxygalactonokinase [Parvicellaceae bacterium]